MLKKSGLDSVHFRVPLANEEPTSSNAMLPSHLSETQKHGRAPFSGTECSKVCLEALPCGAETCATRILSRVNDEA